MLPYLRSLGDALAGGGKSLGGGIERFRLVLGLQGARLTRAQRTSNGAVEDRAPVADAVDAVARERRFAVGSTE